MHEAPITVFLAGDVMSGRVVMRACGYAQNVGPEGEAPAWGRTLRL